MGRKVWNRLLPQSLYQNKLSTGSEVQVATAISVVGCLSAVLFMGRGIAVFLFEMPGGASHAIFLLRADLGGDHLLDDP